MRNLTAKLALICGITALLGSQCYHVASRPEWTQAQAFRAQWPILAVGVALAGIGCLLPRR